MYFNNSKGFDAHFLIPMLDKRGYEPILPYDIESYKELTPIQQQKVENRILLISEQVLKSKKVKDQYEKLKSLGLKTASKYISKLVEKRWNKLLPKEYSTVTNENNQVYEIKIGLGSYKRTGGVKNNRALIIRDNLLLFPSSIANMGKSIVKYMVEVENKDKAEMEERYLKKELSSGYTRSKQYANIEELQNDGNELEYLLQDTYILWAYHNLMEKYFPRSLWKMTIASTAYKEWELLFGGKLVEEMISNGTAERIYEKRGAERILYKGKKYQTTKFKQFMVDKVFPTKWLDTVINEDGETIHDDLYKYYGGGITHVNEKYRGQVVENITFLDINSSYPSRMVMDVDVPYGRGVRGDKKGYDFKFYKLIPKKKITNKKGLPFLWNQHSAKRAYLKTLLPNTVYKMTSIAYERFKKYYTDDESLYTIEIEYSFKTMKIKNIFNEFIDKWYTIKEQASLNKNIILKTIAKLFLNSLYGKYGTKKERVSKVWNKEEQEWESYSTILDSKYYLPIAIAITEMGRMALVDAVDTNYHNFCYTDTDSIAVRDFKQEDYKQLELDPTKLGAWDIEYKNGVGVFRRPKQYLLINDTKKYKIAFAGINFNKFILPDGEESDLDEVEKEYRKLTLVDFIKGKVIDNQLAPYRLLGHGIMLNSIEKEIKPIWDKSYQPLPEQIYYKKEHFINSLNKLSQMTKIGI